MKKPFFLIITVILLSGLSAAVSCSERPDADEIIKQNTASCKFDKGIFRCHTLFESQICNPEAVKPCQAVFNYPFFYENLTLGECSVTHDGKKLPCKEPSVLQENTYTWGGNRVIGASLPSCAKGDTYTINYSSESYDPRGNVLDSGWYFSTGSLLNGQSAFVEWSKVEVEVPKSTNFYYLVHSKNASAGKEERTGNRTIYTFQQKNIAQIKNEEYLPPFDLLADWVEYGNEKDYSLTSNWTTGLFQPAIQPDEIVSKKANEIAGSSNGVEAAKKIYDWVRLNIRYIPLEFGPMTGFQPHNAREVLEKGFGDCKDFTALLTALLKSKGLDAEPELLSPYVISHRQGTDIFNHVIVSLDIENKTTWLDSTCTECPFGTLPWGSEQATGLKLMTGRNLEKVSYPLQKTASMEDVTYTVLSNGDAKVSITSTALDPVYSETSRLYYNSSNSDETKKNNEQRASSTCNNYQELRFSTSKTEIGVEQFSTTLNFTCPSLAKLTDSGITLQKYDGELFTYPDYLKPSQRNNDIYFGIPMQNNVEIKVEFPEGYSITNSPSGFEKGYENYSITLDAKTHENTATMKMQEYSGESIPKEKFQLLKETRSSLTNAFTPIQAKALEKPQENKNPPTYTKEIAGLVAIAIILFGAGFLLLKKPGQKHIPNRMQIEKKKSSAKNKRL